MDVCSGILLFQVNPDKVFRQLISFEPKTFDLDKELSIITLNCAPQQVTQLPSYFAFSANGYIGNVFYFEYEGMQYSLVATSYDAVPAFFKVYFDEIYDATNTGIVIDSLTETVWKHLQMWKKEKDSYQIYFTSGLASFPIDKKVTTFTYFNPYKYFNDDDQLDKLWRGMYSEKRILIYAEDEMTLTNGLFSALASISPFEYKGNYLIVLNKNDPRLFDNKDYNVIAALKSSTSTITGHFDLIIEATKPMPDIDYSTLNTSLLDRNKKVQEVINYLLDRTLLINPYNDVLEGPYINDNLENEMKNYKKNGTLSPQELRDFEMSETGRYYRKQIIFRESFRNAFLSVEPVKALNGKSKTHLLTIKEFLEKYIKLTEGDLHMKSVLKAHLKLCNNLLKEYSS